jgi:hypothetical protein
MSFAANGIDDEVVRAIRAIHDVSTPNADRIRYTEAIEALKDGSPDTSIPTAFALTSHSDSYVTHVGWNIIEFVIK